MRLELREAVEGTRHLEDSVAEVGCEVEARVTLVAHEERPEQHVAQQLLNPEDAYEAFDRADCLQLLDVEETKAHAEPHQLNRE